MHLWQLTLGSLIGFGWSMVAGGLLGLLWGMSRPLLRVKASVTKYFCCRIKTMIVEFSAVRL